MALVHPVQSDGPTASAPSPTRRSKSPPGGHKLGLVEDAHGVHPRKLVRTGTGPIIGGGGGEPEKPHEANGVGPPALPPHPEPLRKSDSQCSNDGQRLWSQRALSPGAALWPGELAKEGDTAAKRALDCKGEEDGDDGDDDEATAPLAPLPQSSSRLTTGLEGPMSVHGSIGHTVVDDGVEAKPILRKTSSFAHPSDGTMHLRKQGRQLSFADEHGRNLHVVIHATNLQYSSRRVRRGGTADPSPQAESGQRGACAQDGSSTRTVTDCMSAARPGYLESCLESVSSNAQRSGAMLPRPSRGLVRAALRVYQTPKQLRVRAFSRLAELDEEIPGLPALSTTSAAPLTIETSTLPNGIKVVSTEYGKITNVGVAVAAGSRHEAVSEYGSAHVLHKLAFKATQSSTALRFLRNLEQVGSAPSAYAGRESLVYKVTALPEHAGDALAATFETVLTPKITDYGIHDLEETSIKVDLELLAASGQQQLIEALYEAAYGENTPLGHSFYATLAPSPTVLTNFREKTFIGPGFTVMGTGIPHAQLKSWASALTSDVAKDNTLEPPSSEYIGGEVRIKATSETTFVGLAFPAPPKAEAGAVAVLAAAWSNALPAGATSFVLPGLVGVMGSAPYASAGGYVDNLLKVVKSNGGSFENAKNTAKVKELAKMDASTFEALAEGANPGGIDSVSESDVRSLQEKLWKSGVTIASIGNLSTVPRQSQIR